MAKAKSTRRVCHSLFQTFPERPTKEVQCPADMIDQIGGWSTAGVGQAYGEGYSLEYKSNYLSLANLLIMQQIFTRTHSKVNTHSKHMNFGDSGMITGLS